MLEHVKITPARSPVLLRRFRLGQQLSRSATAFVSGFENRANWHVESNGKAELLGRLAAFSPQTVFDVGANVGEWSCLAAELLPVSRIRAFEPVPDTAALLRDRTSRYGSRIAVHQFALGDKPERRTISTDKRSALVSLLDDVDPASKTTAHIEVVCGDDFCVQEGIDHIGMLKVDAEGFDHLVLAGFNRMLAAGAVDVVQFEYGSWALRTKFLLRDFYNLFDELDYVVGKLYPRGVDFRSYNTSLEDFRGLNFVAVTRKRADLIEALAEQ